MEGAGGEGGQYHDLTKLAANGVRAMSQLLSKSTSHSLVPSQGKARPGNGYLVNVLHKRGWLLERAVMILWQRRLNKSYLCQHKQMLCHHYKIHTFGSIIIYWRSTSHEQQPFS